jgi:hypothetical protein
MSNFLAIATVTATLQRTLRAAIRANVPGADVTTVRPDATTDGATNKGVNIFLYHVTPNAAWRNSDLPTRSSNGTLVARPRAALDLHYLISVFGDDGTLEPQRLMGSVVSALHAEPILSRERVSATVADAETRPYLAGSNLHEEIETVRFVPTMLSLEELSRLWSVFFQTPYILSVAYQGSVVLIEPDVTPAPALPVLTPQIRTVARRPPQITAIEPQMVTAGTATRVTIRGTDLGDTVVTVGGTEVAPEAGDTPESLAVTLPTPLRAGILPVRATRMLALDSGPARPLFQSNAAALVVRPTVSSVAFRAAGTPPAREIVVTVGPPLGTEQEVTLLLTRDDGHSVMLTLASRDDATHPVFAAATVAAGRYVVRLRVDGAESDLVLGPDPANPGASHFIGPQVVVP